MEVDKLQDGTSLSSIHKSNNAADWFGLFLYRDVAYGVPSQISNPIGQIILGTEDQNGNLDLDFGECFIYL